MTVYHFFLSESTPLYKLSAMAFFSRIHKNNRHRKTLPPGPDVFWGRKKETERTIWMSRKSSGYFRRTRSRLSRKHPANTGKH